MLRALGFGLLAVFAGGWVSSPVRASEEAAPKTHVVIVGVSDYADSQIKPRPTAEPGAKALYDIAVDPKHIGADKADVQLLLGKADESRGSNTATKDNVLKAITDVAEKAKKDDLVIIAILGQGAPIGDKTAFLPSDAVFKERTKTALNTTEIETAIAKLKSQKLCVLLDLNFKSYEVGKDEVIADPPLRDLIKVFIGPEDKEEHVLPPGRVIMLSNNSISQPLETENNSIFMKLVLDGLKGAADTFGYEPDGRVTVDELDAFIDKEMPKLSRQLGKTTEEKEQAAIDIAAKINHFALSKNPAVQSKVAERLKKFETINLPADVAAEGRKLLTAMPKLRAEQTLRKEYQKLADGQTTAEAFLKLRSENLAARKMVREDAETYAKRVLRGIRLLKDQYVKELNSGEMAGWAIKGMYRRLEEKVPSDIKERLEKVKEMLPSELELLLTEARETLGKREDLERNKDVDISLQMVTANLDPYTVYIDEETKRRTQSEMRGEFEGIGIQIRRVAAKDALLVVTPIKGSPAYKAGLKAGDLITELETDQDETGRKMPAPKTFSTQGMKTETAVKHILGNPGTKVKVTVMREGASQPMQFEITRGRVMVETVLGVHRHSDDSWEYMIDPESKIGYIRLTQFAPNSFKDMEEVVKKMSKNGLRGLVLDLRNNPGGMLTTAVQISDMFIDDGLIVTIKPRIGQEHPYGGASEGSYLDFPMVCLVNDGSASGSEIVAAALQDHKRAVILGERSYGKGSVQNVQSFPATGGEMKFTTASFWRPNGKNLNKSSTKGLDSEDWGVRPDNGYNVKLQGKERLELDVRLHENEIIPNRDAPKKEVKEFKDRQLEGALDYLRSQIKTAAKAPTSKNG
jgi:C-terminal peptidase prc